MSNKIRLIFFLPNFTFGGAANSIFKLCKFLSNKNFSILIISLGKNTYKRELIKNNCEVIEINYSRLLFAFFKLRKIVKKNTKLGFSKTILISNIHYANIISSLIITGIKKIKLILVERTSLHELKLYVNFFLFIKNRIIFFLIKYMYSKSDLIITNSKFENKFLRSIINKKKILTIHPPTIKKIEKININKKNKKKFNIIYVGRLSKEKGIDIIITALSYIKKKYDFELKIIGNGPLKKQYKRLVKELKLDKNISFIGNVTRVKKFYKKADLFINASSFEGLPNAIVEAINYGVTVICSDCPGGNMEVIQNGKSGIYFKTNNVHDLTKKIILYFKKPNFFRQKFNFNRNNLRNYLETKSYLSYLKILNKI